MNKLWLLLTFALAGCNALSERVAERIASDQQVSRDANMGPTTGIIATPDGGDIALISEPPVPLSDLCFVRSQRMRGVFVARACAKLAQEVDK